MLDTNVVSELVTPEVDKAVAGRYIAQIVYSAGYKMNFVLARLVIIVALTSTTPAWSATAEQTACSGGCIDPIAAVVLANRPELREPETVKVLMTVRTMDVEEGPGGEPINYYFNSEEDYRSPISVNLKIAAEVAHRLANGTRIDALRTAFLNKRIVVQGIPKRVKILFSCHGKATGKYYYQTHIDVTNAEQISTIEGENSQTSSTNRP